MKKIKKQWKNEKNVSHLFKVNNTFEMKRSHALFWYFHI